MNIPNTPQSDEHTLLVDATQKLIELRSLPTWRNELPSRCPPILWFGNARSTKPIVVTIGANPSRQEYLADSSAAALNKMATTNDERALSYLERSTSRFRLLERVEKLEDILTNAALRESILGGYNSYFSRNPYNWFGKRQDPYNVEGFLRGFGASYYPNQSQPFQAVHIDLFPFATLNDFKSIQRSAEIDLFSNGWAQSMLSRLLTLLKPRAIIAFGRTNVAYYSRYVDRSTSKSNWHYFMKASYSHGIAIESGLPFIGLSTNLGNPIGFNKASLNQFGREVALTSGIMSTHTPRPN